MVVFDYEPDVSVFGVYKDKATALANQVEAENDDPNAKFWIEDWPVEAV